MPRFVPFECNKMHGFLRMNHFADQKLAPCVRSKIFDYNTDLESIKDNYYTIKVVKDIKLSCAGCKNLKCDNCIELECLYEDFGLPIKIKATKNDFEFWTKEQSIKDAESLFYYYKSFNAKKFGKLIINDRYYCIEAIDEEHSDFIECTFFWKNDDIFSVSMEQFSQNETDDILSYARIIEKTMKPYLYFNYSIIMNFAFTEEPYFSEGDFSETNLLFYGLRTAYNKVDLEFTL